MDWLASLDWLLVWQMVAAAAVVSHILIMMMSRGRYLEILKSIVFRNGVWRYHFSTSRGVTQKFYTKAVKIDEKDGTNFQQVYDRDTWDGKPAYVTIEGQSLNVDIHNNFPYSKQADVINKTLSLAYSNGFKDGYDKIKNTFVEQPMFKLLLIAIVVGIAVVAYLIYNDVIPVVTATKSAVGVLQQTLPATIGIVPGA